MVQARLEATERVSGPVWTKHVGADRRRAERRSVAPLARVFTPNSLQ